MGQLHFEFLNYQPKGEMPIGQSSTQLSEDIQTNAPTEPINGRQNPQRVISKNISKISINDAEWLFFFFKKRRNILSTVKMIDQYRIPF